MTVQHNKFDESQGTANCHSSYTITNERQKYQQLQQLLSCQHTRKKTISVIKVIDHRDKKREDLKTTGTPGPKRINRK